MDPELIPTNEMDVIDAMSCNGKLEVGHWDEKDDDSTLPMEDQYFWRQTFDCANTKTFSKLRHVCIDQAPVNPDEVLSTARTRLPEVAAREVYRRGSG